MCPSRHLLTSLLILSAILHPAVARTSTHLIFPDTSEESLRSSLSFHKVKTHLNMLPPSPQLGSAPLMAFGIDMLFLARLLPFGPLPLKEESTRLNLDGQLTNEALATVETLTLVRNALRSDKNGLMLSRMTNGVFNDTQRVFLKGPVNIASGVINRNKTEVTDGIKQQILDTKDVISGNRRLLSTLSIAAKIWAPTSTNPLIVSVKNFQAFGNMAAIPGILFFPEEYLLTPINQSCSKLLDAKNDWDRSLSEKDPALPSDTAFVMLCTRFLAFLGNLQHPIFVLLQPITPSLWKQNVEITSAWINGILPYVPAPITSLGYNAAHATYTKLLAGSTPLYYGEKALTFGQQWGPQIFSKFLYGNAVGLQIGLSEVSLWAQLHQSFSDGIAKTTFAALNFIYWAPFLAKKLSPNSAFSSLGEQCFWAQKLSPKITTSVAIGLTLIDFIWQVTPLLMESIPAFRGYTERSPEDATSRDFSTTGEL